MQSQRTASITHDTGLLALSPHDGRYRSQLTELSALFSEFGLIKYRVYVEVQYLIFLSKNKLIPKLNPTESKLFNSFLTNFSLNHAQEIKDIERQTKHDVKAVELFLTAQLQKIKSPLAPFVHLALTSEDTNSLAYSLMLTEAEQKIIFPLLQKVLSELNVMIKNHAGTSMLARTHGQIAAPTTVGKELSVFAHRLLGELTQLEKIKIEGKLNGAVGNFNAHCVAWPQVNWLQLGQKFITSLGLLSTVVTTQILPAESYNRIFASLIRINGILLDLNQDLWRYISDDYLLQKLEMGQVGSSTMPHKINPIDFENSEGNLGLANALLTHFMLKLPISRLQRDLSDSTVKRNFGIALGYCVLAYKSLAQGLTKLSVNQSKLKSDLNQHWVVMAEAYQVILRLNGDDQGYQKLQHLTQGQIVTQKILHDFVKQSSLSTAVKQQLLNLTPFNYLGLSVQIANSTLRKVQKYLERKS